MSAKTSTARIVNERKTLNVLEQRLSQGLPLGPRDLQMLESLRLKHPDLSSEQARPVQTQETS